MTVVPQEIYDEIIDHLHDTKTELATCALVCRAWIPSSRHHLFSVVHITIDEPASRLCVVRFLDLLTHSEYVLPFIHEVHVDIEGQGHSLETSCLTKALIILRDTAPRYQSVSFTYFHHYSPLNLREILPLHRLTEFSLKYGYNRQDIALCSAMPCLQKLAIVAIDPNELCGDFIKENMVLPQLHSLTVCGPESEILRSLAPPPLLRDLTLGVLPLTDMRSVGAFLRPLAHNIKHLCLICFGGAIDDDTMNQLGLRRMTHLRSLIIHLLETESSLERESLPAALDNVTSYEVDHIEFCLDLQESFAGDHWIGIRAILERPNFRRLRKLEFRLEGRRDIVLETEAWIARQLQGLRHDVFTA